MSNCSFWKDFLVWERLLYIERSVQLPFLKANMFMLTQGMFSSAWKYQLQPSNGIF